MPKPDLLDHSTIIEQATAERWRAIGSILEQAGRALSRPPSLVCLSVGAVLFLMAATDLFSPERVSVARAPSSNVVGQLNEPSDVATTGSISHDVTY